MAGVVSRGGGGEGRVTTKYVNEIDMFGFLYTCLHPTSTNNALDQPSHALPARFHNLTNKPNITVCYINDSSHINAEQKDANGV